MPKPPKSAHRLSGTRAAVVKPKGQRENFRVVRFSAAVTIVNPSLPTSKDDARVDTPEAESVGNRMLHGHAPCLAGHDVDALSRRVAIVEIESGRCHLVPQREDREDCFGSAGCAE